MLLVVFLIDDFDVLCCSGVILVDVLVYVFVMVCWLYVLY